MKLSELRKVDVSEADVWTQIKTRTADDGAESFYIFDVADVVRKYYNWRKLMPRIHPYFAVKCNPHPNIIELLASLGTGFDCASKQEMAQILSTGVDPSRIIFANTTKVLSHLDFAHDNGVRLMTFDNEFELHKVSRRAPNAKMVLRIRHDDPLAFYPLGKKFGCDPSTDAPKLLALARTLGVHIEGVCFHIGSLSNNPKAFEEAIRSAAKVFEHAKSLGHDPKLLDIGGGFLGETGTSIEAVAAAINRTLEACFPDPSIRVISEPGRYFVSSSFTLATKIHSKRVDRDEDGQRRCNYYMDVGIFNAFQAALFDEPFRVEPLENSEGAERFRSTLWGPTCDPADKVVGDVELPEMDVGDWLVFEDMGAYSTSISCNFNGFESPEVHLVVNGKTRKLLKEILPKESLDYWHI